MCGHRGKQDYSTDQNKEFALTSAGMKFFEKLVLICLQAF